MRETKPEVFVIARTAIDWEGVDLYLRAVGGIEWLDRRRGLGISDAETLVEFMGRMCYRSWAPGLNANVQRIRSDTASYLANIITSQHGSVLEHATYTLVFHNVSRVFTHELVRHRAGTAISQESLRYVRLTDLPFAHPQFVLDNPELRKKADALLAAMEEFQEEVVIATDLDSQDFNTKKQITSAARRYAPDGLSTGIGWTANLRTLRHVLATRTAPGAEIEIRQVFDEVGRILQDELPFLFGDFTRTVGADGEPGVWIPGTPKI